MITSSRHYITNGLNAAQIVDTIRHEIAHALDTSSAYARDGRRLAHGKWWKAQCVVTGARPRATADMAGYINPDSKSDKWTMVLLATDKNSVEYFRTTPKFLKNMHDRFIKKHPETLGRLWLVDTKDYIDYIDGHKELSDLLFW